ncbi:hypothetical protein NPS46_20095 [Pseudomonas putida]|uniref:hypothetical protein n=1 Tax=Pseudomonas putida TaxID=303 RepID=UPI002363C596|nr:hypothetical protein [Pseudomonas putida]MDD2054852.1 hypothetical protein [Pseudomonas putida]
MPSIFGSLVSNGMLTPSMTPQAKDAETDAEAIAANGAGAQAEKAPPATGVQVTLSEIGLKISAGGTQKSSNSDIDDSSLPDNVKNLLKMIRKLQQELAEKRAELQAVMSDRRMSPEQMQARLSALQSEIASLSAGLISANGALTKALKDLTSDQVMDVAKLLSSG